MSRRSMIGGSAALCALPALALPTGAGAGATATDPAARLHALLDESAAADQRLDPLSTTKPAGAAVFIDPLSDAYATALLGQKQREMATLATIARARLGADDRIAYDVLSYRAQQMLDTFASGAFRTAQLAPLDPSFGLQVELPDFVTGAGAPFANEADYEAGLARLEGFAGHMDKTIERLREGRALGVVQPQIIVANMLRQVDATLAVPVADSAFFKAARRFPDSLSQARRASLVKAYREVIEQRVYPGYQSWRDYLRGTYLAHATTAPGRWAMKGGQALYAAELSRHTTTQRSAEDIHTLGLLEVARIRGEMEEVRSKVGFSGDLKAFFEHIRTDPQYYYKTPQQLLARFKAIEAKIWPAIPKLFHDRPRAPFEVRPLPALGDQRGTGYYRPGEPDGVSPGILFFNMSMLSTRPIPTLETLTLHEGIPGHHFQLTLARENTALPAILRNNMSTAFTEGWGLYAESLGPELGMFGDLMQWFGHLDMEILRAIRLVVDTGLHERRWDRDKAIAYMLDNSSMAPKDVAVEIDRYIAYPGQACAYKIGELKLRELRERSAAALQARFDVRDYHREALNTGALPIDVLDTKITAWIASRGLAT
ncbi:MAG: DUF885 domain-containing protein [Sphingomonadales bacterium]|nr:MAG: DUF885 domain-containing protein [Sphingomonadales bacterium]